MTHEIITGNCFEHLPQLDSNSVHAIVTDPPYGLAFMGRSWDDFEPKEYQEWCEQWATECLRVLKPGGHLLAFSGNRTHHRLMSGIEDAGYEIRDTITWHYGNGFPKSLDVSKAIDKQADTEREVVGTYINPRTTKSHEYANESDAKTAYSYDDRDAELAREKTAPATDAAEQWDGFKSALKPATEFVCVARAPLSEGTIAENVLIHGTGALNIDGCRIKSGERPERTHEGGSVFGSGHGEQESRMADGTTTEGRYPSNVVFDAQQADVLDYEVGELDAGAHTTVKESESVNTYSDKVYTDAPDERTETGSGGPSRYFYTSKASKSERTLEGKIDNSHPTVKPLDLMEWLVTLATAEGQTIVDPFCGTGTTCKAAKDTNRQFIGVEEQSQWADIARVRTGLTADDHSHVRSDDAQQGFEQY